VVGIIAPWNYPLTLSVFDAVPALAAGNGVVINPDRHTPYSATGPHLDSQPALYWELIAEDGEVVGVICPDCLTLREQRAIRAEKARVIRRLKRRPPL